MYLPQNCYIRGLFCVMDVPHMLLSLMSSAIVIIMCMLAQGLGFSHDRGRKIASPVLNKVMYEKFVKQSGLRSRILLHS